MSNFAFEIRNKCKADPVFNASYLSVRRSACLLSNVLLRGVIWCPSEDHDCHSFSEVRALLLESIWVPKALNCSVFGVWNNVVCMQLQVQCIMKNENILKIKETFFFVSTVHRVSLTPTLNLQGSFYKPAFCLFRVHAGLTLGYPALFLHAR